MWTRRAEPKRLKTNEIYSTWWRIWAKPAHQYHTKHATVSDILGFTVFQTVQAYTALRVIVPENERRFSMHLRCYLTDSKLYMQNYIPSVTKFSTTGLAASPGLVRLLSLLQLGRLLYSSARRIKFNDFQRFSCISCLRMCGANGHCFSYIFEILDCNACKLIETVMIIICFET